MRAVDIARRLCRRARPEYLEAFEQGDALLDEAGINTPLRLAHFLAQVLHETGGLTVLVENHRYSAKNLANTWDDGNWHRYFPNKAALVAMAGQGERLFNIVYGNRMGNGGPETGDGFRYRGRGILQTTGREAYRKYGIRCGVDFEGNPDLVTSAEHALKPALAEWTDGRCNAMADRGDIAGITRRINGGLIGFEDRKAWLARTLPACNGVEIKPRPPVKPAATGAAGGAVVVTTITAAKSAGYDWTTIGAAAALVVLFCVVAFIAYKATRKSSQKD